MPAGTHSRDEWTAIASRLDLRRGAFNGGELVDGASGRTLDRIKPATGELLAQVAAVTRTWTAPSARCGAHSSGLAASIWTSNLGRAHQLARRLRAGTVSVNTVDVLSPQTPFGGFKQPGFGRYLSLHALDKYTGLKTTWIKF
jgi:acyl-CoA reductase-like NAD-dependent aldehyde dehydrogenase